MLTKNEMMTKEEIDKQVKLFEKSHSITKLPTFMPWYETKQTIKSHSKRSNGGYSNSYTKPAGYRNSSVYNYLENYSRNARTKVVEKHISDYRKEERK